MTLETLETLWLVTLLILWAGLLFGGFVFGTPSEDGARRMPIWTRIASSLALVVAAWSWFLIAQGSDFHRLALFIAAGMTLGFIGDLFMAQLLPLDDYVLGGMAAFGLGHVAYIAGILDYANVHNLTDAAARWGSLAGWLGFGVAGWYVIVFRGAKTPTILHKAALPYALLLATTTGMATGLALQDSTFALMGLGAALFLLSDLILAAQLFNGLHFRLIGDVVWLTYGPGQMLIVFAVALSQL